MSTFDLNQFSLAHGSLLEVIDHIQPFVRSYAEVRLKLRELEKRLFLFFGKEDKAFFDTLYVFYEEDRPSSKMIDFLIHDLKELKINYLTFFDQHSAEATALHARSFPKDFSIFSDQIIGRIKIEQEYLLPLLEKMANG
jgi:hypothetical protein